MPKKSNQRKRKERPPPKVHIYGNSQHNTAFMIAIGQLVVNWANAESIFRAILDVLLRDEPTTMRSSVVWFSFKNTQARLDLVSALARQEIIDETLLADLMAALQHFKSLTDTRHYYCHSMYQYDDDGNIVWAFGASMQRDGDPIRTTRKRLNRARLNEIQDVSHKLVLLNRRLWTLVDQLGVALGVPTEELLPPQFLTNKSQ